MKITLLLAYQMTIKRIVMFLSRGLRNKSKTEYFFPASSSFCAAKQLFCKQIEGLKHKVCTTYALDSFAQNL